MLQLLFLIKDLCLGDMWLGVAPSMDATKNVCFKEIGLRGQNMMTIVGLIVYIIGASMCHVHEHEICHFDSE